jgi:hypothetical protein
LLVEAQELLAMPRTFTAYLVCALAIVAKGGPLTAAEAARPAKAFKPEANVVELFAGIESGEIEVKVIPKDSTGGNLMVTNKTDKPLTIKVPPAFAGVPVLAQLCGGGFCGGGGGMGGGGGGNQGFGGGMGGGMGGMGGMMGGMGGGMFNIAPDKVTKVKFAAVCLDHGKDDPNPRVEYKLVPIDEYAKDPAVTEVIKLMLAGKIDQHSTQAAAWHLQNGLSWEDLSKKIGAKHLNGSVEPYFTAVQLRRALAATKFAQEHVEKSNSASAEKSPGENQ